MVLSSNINYWLCVVITLKNRSTLATKTVNLINREVISNTAPDYFPLIESISSLGVSMNERLPVGNSGEIVLLDNLNSYGVERKFSDLLERYEIIDQPIEIKFSKTNASATIYGSWTTIAKGVCGSYTRNADSEKSTLSITVDMRLIPRVYYGQLIEYDTTVLSAAPSSSMGRVIQMPIGSSVDCQANYIATESGRNAYFAWGTQLHDEIIIKQINYYAAANSDGNYVTLSNANSSNVVTTLYSGDTTTNTGGIPKGEWAFDLSVSDHYLVTGGRLKCFGSQVAGTVSGYLTVRIYGSSASPDNAPKVLLGTALVDKSQYDASFDGGATFWINWTFDKAVLLNYAKHYISFSDHYTANPSRIPYRYNNTLTADTFYKDEVPTISQNWYVIPGTGQLPLFEVHGVYFEELTGAPYEQTSKDGYRARLVRLNQYNPTYQTAIDLSGFNFIVNCEGLKDDGAGSFTGIPDLLIEDPLHVINLLLGTKWNNTSVTWFDTTNYTAPIWSWETAISSSPYARTVSGSVTGQTTLEELINQICRNTAYKIGFSNNGYLCAWGWGGVMSVSKTFTQENARITSINVLDSSYIINALSVRFGKTIQNQNYKVLSSQPNVRGYSRANPAYAGLSALLTNLIGNSESLYGRKYLADDTFDWIRSSDSVDTIMRYFLAVFNSPPVYVEIYTPLDGNESINLLDVVNLQFPEMPNFYGSSNNALKPNVNGLPVDISQGFTYTRAQQYRAQIEGRNIDFTEDEGPILRLTCRLLLNSPDDPT